MGRLAPRVRGDLPRRDGHLRIRRDPRAVGQVYPAGPTTPSGRRRIRSTRRGRSHCLPVACAGVRSGLRGRLVPRVTAAPTIVDCVAARLPIDPASALGTRRFQRVKSVLCRTISEAAAACAKSRPGERGSSDRPILPQGRRAVAPLTSIYLSATRLLRSFDPASMISPA